MHSARVRVASSTRSATASERASESAENTDGVALACIQYADFIMEGEPSGEDVHSAPVLPEEYRG